MLLGCINRKRADLQNRRHAFTHVNCPIYFTSENLNPKLTVDNANISVGVVGDGDNEGREG